MRIKWFLQGVGSTVVDLVKALFQSRTRRMVLILPVLLLIALVFALVSSSGVLAPFLYPLF
jgi:hypothetical protein